MLKLRLPKIRLKLQPMQMELKQQIQPIAQVTAVQQPLQKMRKKKALLVVVSLTLALVMMLLF